MIPLVIILVVLAVVLLCVEMFLPSFGICGILGIILFIVSAVITVVAIPFGVFFLAGEVIFFALVIWIVINYIRKHQLHNKLILGETLNVAEKEIGNLDYFIGKTGVTKTPLRPFGTVDFDGVPVEVSSDGSYISENSKVRVMQVQNQKIIVKLTEGN